METAEGIRMEKKQRRKTKQEEQGEMIMGIRKELLEEGTKIESEKEGIMTVRIKIRKEKWRIISV